MKRRILIAFFAVVCMAAFCFGFTAAIAEETNFFDGQTNLALDGSKWTKGSKTSADWYTIGEGGIEINQYGAGSAPTAVSLKELLPYEGVLKITFNSVVSDSGYLKVVFADNSGSVNGLAMKPWEISGKVEHIAVEINNTGVFLWHYNKGNEYGQHGQLGINAAETNYIDGNDHVLTVEYKASESAYKLKMSIDETVHYDNTVATDKLFVNSVLTLGGYGNSLVEDKLTVKSVTVEKKGEDPAPVIDENNLLGKADKWTLADGVTLDDASAVLTAKNYTGKVATLKDALPSEAKITMKLELLDVPASDNHKAMVKFGLFRSEKEEVFLQLDADGNAWLLHNDLVKNEKIASAGDWAPGMLAGLNTVSIEITPELTNGDEDVFVYATVAGNSFGLPVENLDFVAGNYFDITACGVGGFKFTEVKVEDMVQEKPDSATVVTDLLKNGGWSYVSSNMSEEKIELGGQDYLKYAKALPVEGEVSFTIKGTANCNSWYYFGFGNFESTLWDGEKVTEKQNRFRITTTGSQGFYTIGLSDGNAVAKKSSDTTVLFDGTNQTFTWKTEKVEEGLKITLTRNGIEEFSNVYANDTAFGSSEKFYLMFRATGAHTESPVITNVTSTYTEKVDVEAYNAAIAIKRAIYALSTPSEETASTVKAEAQALIEGLTDAQLEVVTNVRYAEYIIEKADALLEVVADKEVAKAVSDKIEALKTTYATITAENVEAAKTEIATVKAEYEALTDAQKSYVANYEEIANVEQAVTEFENQQSSSDTGASSSGSGDSSSEEEKGCLGSVSAGAFAAIAALAVGGVVLKKKEY